MGLSTNAKGYLFGIWFSTAHFGMSSLTASSAFSTPFFGRRLQSITSRDPVVVQVEMGSGLSWEVLTVPTIKSMAARQSAT